MLVVVVVMDAVMEYFNQRRGLTITNPYSNEILVFIYLVTIVPLYPGLTGDFYVTASVCSCT